MVVPRLTPTVLFITISQLSIGICLLRPEVSSLFETALVLLVAGGLLLLLMGGFFGTTVNALHCGQLFLANFLKQSKQIS
jgi:hypothetical protein